MDESSRIIGTAGEKGCKYRCVYCFTREPDYKRSPRFDILRTRDLVRISCSSQVIQPVCDTELLLTPGWKNYIDELVSTGKIISFATKSEIEGDNIEFLKGINEILMSNKKVLHVGITIVKLVGWKEIEPNAPSPEARIATLRRLWENGIPTTVLVRPIIPTLTKHEIKEIVEKTYRFCHGYLAGPLYLTPAVEQYLNQKNIKYLVTERIATWQKTKPKLRVIECSELEEELRINAELKGRRLFENNVDAAIFSNDILNQNWTERTKWMLGLRRERVSTVYIVDLATKEFLLIFNRKLGKWLSPGGHVNEGETSIQAAIREVKEETGLDVRLLKIKGEIEIDGKDYRRVKSNPESEAFCTIEEFIYPIGAQDPHIHVDSIYVGIFEKGQNATNTNRQEISAIDHFPIEEISLLSTFDNVPTTCKAILSSI